MSDVSPGARGAAVIGAISLALLLVSAGCSKPYVRQYEAAVEDNYRRLQQVRLGMSRAQVEERMGSGQLVGYKRVQLRNPWRTDAFAMRGGVAVEVLYYVTQGYVWSGYDDAHSLTPVVLEDGKVVGWGWEFLKRHRDRYVLERPAGN